MDRYARPSNVTLTSNPRAPPAINPPRPGHHVGMEEKPPYKPPPWGLLMLGCFVVLAIMVGSIVQTCHRMDQEAIRAP